MRFSSLETDENDPIVEEVSGGQVNVAITQENISGILAGGEMPGQTRIGTKNFLSL